MNVARHTKAIRTQIQLEQRRAEALERPAAGRGAFDRDVRREGFRVVP